MPATGAESLSAGGQSVMKHEIHIPHRRAVLHEGMLRTDSGNGDLAKPNEHLAKTMAHELRTPLNVIIGLCQLLERDQKNPLSPTQRDAVDRMEKNAHSLLQSVNHLLECVRKGRFE